MTVPLEPAAGHSAGILPAQGAWFGHPPGLTVLFATEMWERFSYYGMRALLVLYMVGTLLQPEHASNVVGLAALKSALESLSGPLEVQPFASHIYGLYTGLVYLTPILGGLIADRWLGRRITVIIGAGLMMAGHFLMANESLFLVALLLLITGNGAFKPNISTQVGGLYAPDDARRDRAYSIFYVGINVGAFFSPLVCGTLGETYGWHTGFAAAGVGMLIGLAIYVMGASRLPADEVQLPLTSPSTMPTSSQTTTLAPALLALLVLFVPSALFWAAYEQQGNTIALWADGALDRHVNLGFWNGDIPVTWFQAINPLMIFAFTPPLVSWWAARARSGQEPATLSKLAMGCFGLSLGYLVLAYAAASNGVAPVSWLWLLAHFAIISIAELYFSPIGLSFVSQIAPDKSRSLIMGLWLATSFTGNLFAGWLGSLWSHMPHATFFLTVAGIAACAGGIVALAQAPLARLLPDTAGRR